MGDQRWHLMNSPIPHLLKFGPPFSGPIFFLWYKNLSILLHVNEPAHLHAFVKGTGPFPTNEI